MPVHVECTSSGICPDDSCREQAAQRRNPDPAPGEMYLEAVRNHDVDEMEQARLDDDIAARKQVFDANRKAATREKDRARSQLVMADGKARRTIEKAIWQCQPRVARLLRELQGISLSEGAEAEKRKEAMMMTSEHFEARVCF